MARKTFSPEQIIRKLRDEVLNREILIYCLRQKYLLKDGDGSIIISDHTVPWDIVLQPLRR